MNAPDRKLKLRPAANKAERGVGARTPLVDGIEKVTGTARYTADLPANGALVGKILRSPYAHAELLEVDISEAAALPGVRCVITGAECDTPYGVIPIAQNEYPLARERVRYIGEPVAAVAAVDEATADLALSRIRLKVRELPAYFKAADARAGRCRAAARKQAGQHRTRGAQRIRRHRRRLCRRRPGARGNLRMRRGAPRHDGTQRGAGRLGYRARPPDPVVGDPGALLRAPDPGRCMAMEAAHIRVIKPFVGGGFGHRTECLNFEIICGLLARAARGTVRLLQTREESLPRPPRPAGNADPAQARPHTRRPHHRLPGR
jgi:4-hydroxybenzoyl-CoA reductase subunit alpha